MKLVEAVEGILYAFWHDNTSPFSNAKDVSKCYRVLQTMNPTLNIILTLHKINFIRPRMRVSRTVTSHEGTQWYGGGGCPWRRWNPTWRGMGVGGFESVDLV